MSLHASGCAFYRDVFGGWRWEYTDAAGDVTDSRTSYDTRDECVEAARRGSTANEGLAVDGEGLHAFSNAAHARMEESYV